MHMSWIAVIPFLWIHMMMTVTVRIVATAIPEVLQVIFPVLNSDMANQQFASYQPHFLNFSQAPPTPPPNA